MVMSILVQRLFQGSPESYFLFGPRGTGKTTWLKQHYKPSLMLDLLIPDSFRRFSAKPERLIEEVHALPQGSLIIIDEVQKLPELLEVVHSLIEEKQGWQFILTGSSARKLKCSGVDLLAGRVGVKYLHPFLAFELGEYFTLETALIKGMLPVVFGREDSQEALQAYVSLYIKEEVQLEGIVRNIGDFNRFLEIISFSHASVINMSNIAQECEIDRRVAQTYVQILEDLLLAFRIKVFTKRAKRETIKHEKFYYFDAGVYKCLRPAGPLDRREEIDGHCLEGIVAQHLRAWLQYGGHGELYYWRTRKGTEVDFIVYGKEVFYAIEVKNSDKIKAVDTRGLKAFLSDYPEARAILLYRGKARLKIDNILCIPVDEFLQQLDPSKPLVPN